MYMEPRPAPLHMRDEHYTKRDRWRLLDATTRSTEELANVALEAALARGPVSPRTVRNAVRHRMPAPAWEEPPPPSYPAIPESVPSYASEDEPPYDAVSYGPSSDKWREENEALRARLAALEREVTPRDNAVEAATKRIQALERRVASLRKQPPAPIQEQSVAPTYEDELCDHPSDEPPRRPSSALWADAARSAAERRESYRRERAAVRAEEAALELRELARRRRALSASGPFENLMRREAQMADRKRQREAERRLAESRARADAKFKAKPPPTQRPIRRETQKREDRAAARLAQADNDAPRVASVPTAAARAKQRQPMHLVSDKPPTSPAVAYKRHAARRREAATAKARLEAQRMRWDAFVRFHRRPEESAAELPSSALAQPPPRDGS